MTAISRPARGILRETAIDDEQARLAFLSTCASPAEQALVACMFAGFRAGVCGCGKRAAFRLDGNYPAWAGLFTVFVEPDKHIRVGSRYCRATPYLYLSRLRMKGAITYPEMGRIIIAIGDRAKGGAELAAHGYGLLEFSRADAIDDPWACIEAIDYELNEQAETIFAGFRETGRLDELITGYPE